MSGVNYKSYGGTVGTTPQQCAPQNTGALNYSTFILQNQSSSNFIYYTLDGTIPAVGSSNTLTLGPASASAAGQGIILIAYPNAGVQILANASSTVYSCLAG